MQVEFYSIIIYSGSSRELNLSPYLEINAIEN